LFVHTSHCKIWAFTSARSRRWKNNFFHTNFFWRIIQYHLVTLIDTRFIHIIIHDCIWFCFSSTPPELSVW
jgi:hypothetical protein